MFNTTPTDSPRSQASYSSDATVSSSTEEARAPDSTSAPLPTFSTREPASGHNEAATVSAPDGAPAEAVHTDPSVQLRASSKDKPDGDIDSTKADSTKADSTAPVRNPLKQLHRHERVLNLREKQMHLKLDNILKEEEGELDMDIRTAQEMEALISWLKLGQPVQVFRLRCDFGGMHLTLSEDSEDDDKGGGHSKPEMLDVKLFERMLAACHDIGVLDLSDCKLTPANYRMLRRFLMHEHCKVECLLFGGQYMREKEAASLARGLEGNLSLNMLSLSGTALVSSGLKRIIEAVIRNPRINSLWLENVNGCEEQLPLLRLLLVAEHCSYLGLQHPTGVKMAGRDVRLWNDRFQDFCHMLSVNKSLRLLDVSGLDLTKRDFKSLLEALIFNTSLLWLEYGANRPGSELASLINSHLLRNRRAHREALLPYAAAGLDLLVGTVTPDIWPNELSGVLASHMSNATLEQLKKGVDTGFGKSTRKGKVGIASEPG